MNIKKSTLGMKEPTVEEAANNDTTRPKNPSANTIPSAGYVLEIDGKLKSGFETSEAAMKSALALKKKYPQIQINVYDAKKHARTLVELTEKSAVSVDLA
ncbi:MAG TPA: hypothetical protein VI137_11585 [Pseudolabrys sp.]